MADDISTTGSRIVYANRWMRVREDAIRLRDGSPGIYGVVEKADFVVVAALEDGRLHLVEQYRYPVRGRYWELPQGSREAEPGTDPAELARAELREETGLEADEMAYAGHLFLAYGYSAQGYHVFRAAGLRPGPRDLDHEEQVFGDAAPSPSTRSRLCCATGCYEGRDDGGGARAAAAQGDALTGNDVAAGPRLGQVAASALRAGRRGVSGTRDRKTGADGARPSR